MVKRPCGFESLYEYQTIGKDMIEPDDDFYMIFPDEDGFDSRRLDYDIGDDDEVDDEGIDYLM